MMQQQDPFAAAGYVPVGAPSQPDLGRPIIRRAPEQPKPRDPVADRREEERLRLARNADARAERADQRAAAAARAPAAKAGRGAAPNGLTPAAYSKIQGQLKALKLVEAQLNRVQSLYDRHLKGVGLQSFAEYLPTPANRAFNTAANGILPLVRQALSTSAKDGDSDRELAVWQNLIPSSSEYDETNEERMATMRRLIQENRRATEEMLGQQSSAGGGFRVIRRR